LSWKIRSAKLVQGRERLVLPSIAQAFAAFFYTDEATNILYIQATKPDQKTIAGAPAGRKQSVESPCLLFQLVQKPVCGPHFLV
jgi:hypothetical protein